jgi:hypothetical protein
VLGWWRRRREERDRVDQEAREMFGRHGDFALTLAVQRAIQALEVGNQKENRYWVLVRASIRKKMKSTSSGIPSQQYLHGSGN